MDVWHVNVEHPEIRKSNVPIPNLQEPPPAKPSVQFEEILDTIYPQPAVTAPPKRKRKQRNDSVSPSISF